MRLYWEVARRALQRQVTYRTENLAGLFTKQSLPGVGASLGLDRLLAALEKLGKLEAVSTPATGRGRGPATPPRS